MQSLVYNIKKTVFMVFNYKKVPNFIPNVCLNRSKMARVDKFRYLCHTITESLDDNDVFERERIAHRNLVVVHI